MPEYSYKIQNVSGKTFAGKMEAPNEAALLQSLKESGYYPIEVKPAGASKEITMESLTKVKLKDIAVFCRQFATIISAGLTIVNGLDILRHQTENKKLKGILDKVFEQVQKGKSLSETMRQFKEFPSLFVNMVEAGEASGQLEEMLMRMAAYYEKEHKLKSKIKSAMMYPMVITIFALLIVVFLVTKVVPMFVEMFAGFNAKLPLPTRILLAISNGFKSYWYIIFGVIILIIYFIRKYISSGEGRYKFHRLILHMPIFGKINKKIVTSRFARTLSTLLSSGIPVIQAMDIVQKTVTNAVVEAGIERCKDEIKKGVGLSRPIGNIGIFPPMLIEMINIGEESGMLDEMLTKTAQFYDDEVDTLVSGLTTIIEPIIIVLLAGIVGFIIVSIVLPMFDMYKYMG
jgi:type IV pilus assembly protein PilC